MYNDNVCCHYASSCMMRNTLSFMMRTNIFIIRYDVCCHYTSSYIMKNKYCYYTSSHIMKNTLSCITEMFIVIHLLI